MAQARFEMKTVPARIHSDGLFGEKKIDLKVKLDMALKHVLNINELGGANKLADLKKTNGWVNNQRFRYHVPGQYLKTPAALLKGNDIFANLSYPEESKNILLVEGRKWHYSCDDYSLLNSEYSIDLFCRFPGKNPLNDLRFNLDDSHIELFQLAFLAQEARYATCHNLSCLVAKYLWEKNSKIHRIETVATATFDHIIVIINRSGNLHDPKTWGDAWVVDAWYGDKGMIFHATEFKQKIQQIKDFAKEQILALAKIGFEVNSLFHDEVEEKLSEVLCEIRPGYHKYPTYSISPFHPVEYYYDIKNCYPKNATSTKQDIPLSNELKLHKEKFKPCLEKMTLHKP